MCCFHSLQVSNLQLAPLSSNIPAHCPGHNQLFPHVDLHDVQCLAVYCCRSGSWLWLFCVWMEVEQSSWHLWTLSLIGTGVLQYIRELLIIYRVGGGAMRILQYERIFYWCPPQTYRRKMLFSNPPPPHHHHHQKNNRLSILSCLIFILNKNQSSDDKNEIVSDTDSPVKIPTSTRSGWSSNNWCMLAFLDDPPPLKF